MKDTCKYQRCRVTTDENQNSVHSISVLPVSSEDAKKQSADGDLDCCQHENVHDANKVAQKECFLILIKCCGGLMVSSAIFREKTIQSRKNQIQELLRMLSALN